MSKEAPHTVAIAVLFLLLGGVLLLTVAPFEIGTIRLAGGFAAGLGLRVADVLGKPAPDPGGVVTFVVPIGYFWAAALAVPVAAGTVTVAALARREAHQRSADAGVDATVPAPE